MIDPLEEQERHLTDFLKQSRRYISEHLIQMHGYQREFLADSSPDELRHLHMRKHFGMDGLPLRSRAQEEALKAVEELAQDLYAEHRRTMMEARRIPAPPWDTMFGTIRDVWRDQARTLLRIKAMAVVLFAGEIGWRTDDPELPAKYRQTIGAERERYEARAQQLIETYESFTA